MTLLNIFRLIFSCALVISGACFFYHFDGEVDCTYANMTDHVWCFTVRWIEHNYMKDDLVDQFGPVCTKMTQYLYKVEGEPIKRSNPYGTHHITLEVDNNCGPRGVYKRESMTFLEVPRNPVKMNETHHFYVYHPDRLLDHRDVPQPEYK